MATHSSTLAWKIPWMEGLGRLQSMGSLGIRHDWATFSLFTFMQWRRKWQPTPVFLPGESQGWGSRWAAVYGVAQSWTRLKRLNSSSSKNMILNLFSYAHLTSVYDLQWGVFCLFFGLFSYHWVLRHLCIFWILYQIYILQIFFPVCGLSFHSFNRAFSRADVFNCNEV